jgi:hypothetical protein
MALSGLRQSIALSGFRQNMTLSRHRQNMVPCGSRQNMAYCAFFCTLLQLLHKPAFAATPESRTGTAAFKTLFDARRACPEKEKTG